MKRILLTVAAIALSGSVHAQTITVMGDTTGGPVWNRPVSGFGSLSGLGTAVPYQTYEITIDNSAMFRAETVMPSGIGDTYLFLYLGSFDPTDQLTNGVASDDDGAGNLLSRIVGTFADGQYVLVVTGFSNGDFGAFTLELDGAVLSFLPSVSADDLSEDLEFQAANLSFLLANGRFGSLPEIVRNSLGARASTTTHSPEGGALATGSGLLVEGIHLWAEANHRRLDGDNGLDAYISQFQAGADIALTANVVAGLAVGGADLNSDTNASSLEGYSIWLQPYLGFSHRNLRGVASFAFGYTDYDEYTASGVAGNGSSDGFGLAGNLFIAHDNDLGHGWTLSPFAAISAGRESLGDLGGPLLGASDPVFGYFVGATGLELSRTFAADFGHETLSGRGYLRAAAQFRNSDAPDDSFASPGYDDADFGGGLAAGMELALTERFSGRFELSGDVIGNSASEYGGLFQLSMRF